MLNRELPKWDLPDSAKKEICRKLFAMMSKLHEITILPDFVKKEICGKLFAMISKFPEMTSDMVTNMLHGSEHCVWYNCRLPGESQKRETEEQLRSGHAQHQIEDLFDYSDMPDLVTLHEVEEECTVVD